MAEDVEAQHVASSPLRIPGPCPATTPAAQPEEGPKGKA